MNVFCKNIPAIFNETSPGGSFSISCTYDSLILNKNFQDASEIFISNKSISKNFPIAKQTLNCKKAMFAGMTFNNLDWLQNCPHLKILYLPRISKKGAKISFLMQINKPKVIKKDKKDLLALPKGLGKLKVLNINNNQRTFDYSSLKNVNLSALAMSAANIENLQYIEHMPLEILAITDSPLKDISELKKLTKLKELDLNNNSLITDYLPLKELNNLENVKLIVNQSDDNFSMNYLKEMPLETLIITVAMRGVKRPKEIFDRSLSREERQRIHKEYFKKLRNRPKKNISLMVLKDKRIKKLYLNNKDGKIESLTVLKTLPLEELYLGNCKLTDVEIKMIAAEIPTLKKLALVDL